jgi:ABC-type cobalamin/Fe3+-siderophores transport system ATPase subunit
MASNNKKKSLSGDTNLNIAPKYITQRIEDLGMDENNYSPEDVKQLEESLKIPKSLDRIQIWGLWGYCDIDWQLDSQTNLLIGRNGSGKTTLLRIVNAVVNEGPTKELDLVKYNYDFDAILLTFDNGQTLFFKKLTKIGESLKIVNDDPAKIKKDAIKHLGTRANRQKYNGTRFLDDSIFIENTPKGAGYWASSEAEHRFFRKNLPLSLISTFDNFVKDARLANIIAQMSDVYTDLDWELKRLIQAFKSYQYKRKKQEEEKTQVYYSEIDSIAQLDEVTTEDLLRQRRALQQIKELTMQTHQYENVFFDMLNEFLSSPKYPANTKKVEFDEDNDLVFRQVSSNKLLNFHQFSSGEKQLLIILLSVMIMEQKPAVLLLDEPEISLHIDWQMVFIEKIKKLNPNMQIIMATHADSMFFNSQWHQYIKRIEKLSTISSN